MKILSAARIAAGLAFGLALGASTVLGQAPDGPMTPVPGVPIQRAPSKLKVQTVLVNTPVTVRNARGEMVHNLEQAEFSVTDNGVEQKISHFALGGQPVSVVVVVETSARIDPLLPELQKTGILLTQTVTGLTGEAAILGFSDTVDKLLDFTTNADAIESTMTKLQEGGPAAKLYDAMDAAVEMLSGRPEASPSDLGHRRVMLVLSEAHDDGSNAKLGEVLRKAQLANVTIYTVGLSTTKATLKKKPEYKDPPRATPEGTFGMPPAPGTVQTPTTDANANGAGFCVICLAVWAVQHTKDQVTAHALEIAATATGGSYEAAWKKHTLQKAIDEIGGELHSQYTLTYTPNDTNISGYHTISVKVAEEQTRGLSVRARPGYFLATEDGVE